MMVLRAPYFFMIGLSSPKSHVSISLIVGVIIGAVAALAIITVAIFVVFLLFKRRGRRR